MVTETLNKLVTLERKDLQKAHLVDPMLEVLKLSYENKARSSFKLEDVMRGISHFHALMAGEDIVAVTSYKGERMYTMGVHPDYQGGSYAKDLLKEALRLNPETWLSAAIDSSSMLGLMSCEEAVRAGLMLVQSPEEIKRLLQGSPGFKEGDRVETGFSVNRRLASRLRLSDDRLLFMMHSESFHGADYKQHIFALKDRELNLSESQDQFQPG